MEISGRRQLVRLSFARAKKLARAAECLVYSLTPSGFWTENHPKNRGFVGILRGQKCLKRRFSRRSPLESGLAARARCLAAPVGGLDLVADRMRQRHLGNFEREADALGSPIAKARPTMPRTRVALVSVHVDDLGQCVAVSANGMDRLLPSWASL